MAKIKVEKNMKGKSSSSGPAKIVGDEPMKDNPASRQAEGSNKSENSEITKEVKPTTTLPGSPESADDVENGYLITSRVERKFSPDGPEAARKKLNMNRDLRSNLGRSTWSTPVLD
jgi:hypothetical protein